MTNEELETEIEVTYKWWSETAFGVTPQEVGRLGQLWAEFDRRVQDGRIEVY